MWNWLKNAGGWVWDKVKSSPDFLLKIIKTKTGRRFVAMGIVAACHALGFTVPLEGIVGILGEIGAEVSLDTIIVSVIALIGLDGTLNANETMEHFRALPSDKGRKEDM